MHRPNKNNVEFQISITDFYCLIISWTVILSSRLTGNSLRVVIIWYLLSCTSQPPVQKWATWSIYYILANQLGLRALLIPQNNFKNSSSPHGPISVDDRNCQTGKQMGLAAAHCRGCIMYGKIKIPKWQIQAQWLSSLHPHCPVWFWKNCISVPKEKELWTSCFFISEDASPFMRVSYLFNKKLSSIACTL